MKLSYRWTLQKDNRTIKVISASDIEIARDKLAVYLYKNNLVVGSEVVFGITGENRLFYVMDK